jgi:hypothetical protein
MSHCILSYANKKGEKRKKYKQEKNEDKGDEKRSASRPHFPHVVGLTNFLITNHITFAIWLVNGNSFLCFVIVFG